MMDGSDLVAIPVGGKIVLRGNLMIPPEALGIVLFAHGSGSGRKSPRNRFVAKTLQEAKLATLLIDLLTLDEEALDNETKKLRFDIPFLTKRLMTVIEWLKKGERTKRLKIGLFGASTGAAAALALAAEKKEEIKAVVSRGGRPDLAAEFLPKVVAPTLLIVGDRDTKTVELNNEAFALLNCEKKIHLIPNATHLFEEPGALEEAARQAKAWFQKHLK